MENEGMQLNDARYQREKIHSFVLSRKEITDVHRAVFRFFLSLGGVLFSIIVVATSWGVVSNIGPHVMGWVFTWIFWVWFGIAICFGVPYICWRAYRHGVFED